MIVCPLLNASSAVTPFLLPLEPTHSALLRNQVRELLSYVRQLVDSEHHKARGARLVSSDTTTQTALTIFGRACISPVSTLFPQTWRPSFLLRQVSPGLMLDGKKGFTPRQLSANEDSTLPEMYNLGLVRLDIPGCYISAFMNSHCQKWLYLDQLGGAHVDLRGTTIEAGDG
jgi:hypothetical protein